MLLSAEKILKPQGAPPVEADLIAQLRDALAALPELWAKKIAQTGQPGPQGWLTVEEAAGHCRLSASYLYKRIQEGRLFAAVCGNKFRIYIKHLDSQLAFGFPILEGASRAEEARRALETPALDRLLPLPARERKPTIFDERPEWLGKKQNRTKADNNRTKADHSE